VAGDFFHTKPLNIRNVGTRPEEYARHLNFADLNRNAQWAAWLYDNPGVDTDGDGCRGLTAALNCRDTVVWIDEICIWAWWEDSILCWYNFWWETEYCDTVYYTGDGVPEFAGPPSPPSPFLTVESEPGLIRLTWDGRLSESTYDPFIQGHDFEGYHVYAGMEGNPNTLNLLASWDLIDYYRYRYVPLARPSPWIADPLPYTHVQLFEMYGEDFDPEDYPSPTSYFTADNGERYYFTKCDANQGNVYLEHGEIKVNRIQMVRTDTDSLGRTFGHYECVIDNLLPSQPYYFAVTAYDFGFPYASLGPLESSIQATMQMAYASASANQEESNGIDVAIFPNPYLINDYYRQRGYEDPNREGFLERTRRIHFVNMPPRATIKIFTLDGDLVREIDHPGSRYSDAPSHTAWDLITRNTPAAVSGMYLSSIESDWGNQVGKIVIIK
jgi:hypothetical protein